jgi:hypothetical protein
MRTWFYSSLLKAKGPLVLEGRRAFFHCQYQYSRVVDINTKAFEESVPFVLCMMNGFPQEVLLTSFPQGVLGAFWDEEREAQADERRWRVLRTW